MFDRDDICNAPQAGRQAGNRLVGRSNGISSGVIWLKASRAVCRWQTGLETPGTQVAKRMGRQQWQSGGYARTGVTRMNDWWQICGAGEDHTQAQHRRERDSRARGAGTHTHAVCCILYLHHVSQQAETGGG
jgi:hypothetical protein